jgi:hypothetical protein
MSSLRGRGKTGMDPASFFAREPAPWLGRATGYTHPGALRVSNAANVACTLFGRALNEQGGTRYSGFDHSVFGAERDCENGRY